MNTARSTGRGERFDMLTLNGRSIRVEGDLLTRLRAYEVMPGLQATDKAKVRYLLLFALDALEADAPAKAKAEKTSKGGAQ